MMKILKKLIIAIIIIGALWFLLIKGFHIDTVIMKKIYPQKYTTHVNMYAEQNQIDPLFIYAIIKIESNFDPNATSRSNAKGLMQIMPNTANEVIAKLKIEKSEENTLYNPQINIQIGAYYFATLMQQYQNIGVALAAYNAGIGRVNEWIEQGIIKKDGSDLENIPYKETNMYVRKILNTYQIYQDLYGK